MLYHGWDESKLQKKANPKKGLSPEFLSRAMGWYIIGLVDVSEYIPATVLGMPLNVTKTLKELKLQAIANSVAIELMAVTLVR